MTRSILRRVLSKHHWAVLVAHFMANLDGSTQQQRVAAIVELTRSAPGKAHHLFRTKYVTAWATPRIPESFMVLRAAYLGQRRDANAGEDAIPLAVGYAQVAERRTRRCGSICVGRFRRAELIAETG